MIVSACSDGKINQIRGRWIVEAAGLINILVSKNEPPTLNVEYNSYSYSLI